MKIIDHLSRTFLFNSLAPCQLEQITSFTSLKKLDKGDHLFSEGQAATSFFIVVTGSVKLYKLSADGMEQILHIQEAGELLAEAVIFDFDTYPAYCQSIEKTDLIRISKPEFVQLLKQHPEISFKIMAAYSKRMRQLVNKIEELSLHDIKSRLAKYLIENSQHTGDRHIFTLRISKKNLASIIGTIPETLSRTLNFFKNEALITEEKNQIVITDPRKLNMYVS